MIRTRTIQMSSLLTLSSGQDTEAGREGAASLRHMRAITCIQTALFGPYQDPPPGACMQFTDSG
ncbi:unnamed protein product [Periconia digitata]|uniref:Uncharacterized protein n=1 Tax=Periconia digitata TaxID=1303443 RepID=A0A9W4UFG5_9PLEO|nr:unnamed protein product [Periconia digitata]